MDRISPIMRGTIRELNLSLIKGETSVTEICQESLKIIERTKNLNCFISVCQDEPLIKAAQLDEQLAKIQDKKSFLTKNPLFGLPISIKDNFCTKGLLTTCASKMLQNYIPPYTATAVSKLLDANTLVMGKTNMDEFAMGSSSTTSYYGPTANCWTIDRSESQDWYMAGGSSTGSAVSVATGSCFASLGTDTGGSTRQPASLTNVVGFKPTYGLISRFGLIPLAHCLDVVSLIARTVDDVQLIFDAIIGKDENDLTSVDCKSELCKPRWALDLSEQVPLRIGIPESFISQGDVSREASESFDAILRLLSGNELVNRFFKVEIVDLNLIKSKLATECYTIIGCAEIASNMACYDGVKYGFSNKVDPNEEFNRDSFYKKNRDDAFGLEVKKRILLGNYFLLSDNRERYLVKSLKMRHQISEEFAKAFSQDKIDIILMPSTPSTSVSFSEWSKRQNDNKLFHEDYFLIPGNLANLPSISLPAGLSNLGLPIGLQIICDRFHDRDLLSISKFFQDYVLRTQGLEDRLAL